MTLKKSILLILGLTLLLVANFGIYSYHNFKVAEKFSPLALSFDPYTSISSWEGDGTQVTIQGGFVKGLMGAGNNEELLLRSLAPEMQISIKGNTNEAVTKLIRVENVNPARIKAGDDSQFKIIDYHTIALTLTVDPGEAKTIDLLPLDDKDYLEFAILGDNRDGYQTFAQIIEQINAIAPVFTIDNGDLVFGGEPNKYRLFNETVAKLQGPLLTTIGNHDVRENGRTIYTELFGPPYYSFDYRDTHFVFLDSSRGWTERITIPEEQYLWLESDLNKAQGKRIFVVSHIPPVDPRNSIEANTLPDIPGVHETSYFEKLMNDYSSYKNLNHAFPDPLEAQRFENLMSKYRVDTVFLSHIHSYFSYVKDGVQYIISGGAGAELLTQNSFYHYIRVKVSADDNYLEVIQLPSPANNLQDRYVAGLELFAQAIYKEYRTTIWIMGSLAGLVLGWVLWATHGKWFPWLVMVGVWIFEIFKYAKHKYVELRKNL